MRTISYTKIPALFVALAVLTAAASWLVVGFWRDTNRTTYIVRFGDVQGLVPDAPVFYRGMEGGRVTDVAFEPNKQSVAVAIKVDAKLDVRKDASLYVTTAGLLGQTILQFDDVGGALEKASEGDSLQSVREATLIDWRRFVGRIDASFDDFHSAVQSLKEAERRLQRVEEKLDRLLAQHVATKRRP